MSTWPLERFPSPSLLRLSVVQSPPLLARLGLIVREAATARGLPHPGTEEGGRPEGVGEGAGGMTWGKGMAHPRNLVEGGTSGGLGVPDGCARALISQTQNMWAWQQRPHLGVVCV